MTTKRKARSAPASAGKGKKPWKENLTLAQRLEILDYIKANPIFSQLDVAKYYTARSVPFSQGTVSRLIRDEVILRERAKDPARLNDKRQRQVEFPEVEHALAEWVRQAEGQDLGHNYFWNRKSWMKSDIFEQYLSEFDHYQKELGRHALLLVDGFSAHKIDASKFTNVRVEILPPNMTSHIQPLDQGIIRCFKAHYRSKTIHRAIERESGGADMQHMYEINQLEALNLAEQAWWEVSEKTIQNCWRHSGILSLGTAAGTVMPTGLDEPLIVETPPTLIEQEEGMQDAIQELQSSLKALQERGIIAPAAMMSVEELVTVQEELEVPEMWTDEELLQQAQDEIQAAQGVSQPEEDEEIIELPIWSDQKMLAACTELERALRARAEPDLRTLLSSLPSAIRTLRHQQSLSLQQRTVSEYFA
ncbi:DDE-domain-containing protein [Dacryopinax primogenitus]|uniref:DDE-domain-containing protein n=1 Tax=Dacryopinax primogenitus (strain DJM 731) TaxID=1858805 RepID=M5G356_DACPD|nr:DDE-domain-containing protein [Dacryopinax primogenitus]EJU04651.1 DDE-domain-containing protein [Dacryopinax primogenitus]